MADERTAYMPEPGPDVRAGAGPGPGQAAAAYGRPAGSRPLASAPADGSLSAAEVIAAAISLIWLVGVGLFALFARSYDADGSGGALSGLMTFLGIFMPVALIWVAAIAARSARQMREEAARMQAALDALRQSFLAQAQGGAGSVRAQGGGLGAGYGPGAVTGAAPGSAPNGASGAGAPSATPSAPMSAPMSAPAPSLPAAFASTRTPAAGQDPRGSNPPGPASPGPPPAKPSIADIRGARGRPGAPASPPDAQAALALDGSDVPMGDPVATDDFIKALDFPESPEDAEGFRALRAALNDPRTTKLIRAAQDVLTLLSQDGIYMDDLVPDRARPEVWRRFARGERGRQIAGLGGVRDRSSLALTTQRMRQDTIFRDAAHHFLRQFDRGLAAFEPGASDQELAAAADTRTARAFMLLGRVTGTFD